MRAAEGRDADRPTEPSANAFGYFWRNTKYLAPARPPVYAPRIGEKRSLPIPLLIPEVKGKNVFLFQYRITKPDIYSVMAYRYKNTV
jgi:hypothetical protein